MSPELITAIAALISGGGITAGLKILLEHTKDKREARDKEIDARIVAWQTISDKNEGRLTYLERKLEVYERDFRSLERYIRLLEQTIVRAVPPLNLPDRPVLEREMLADKAE
ncbi:hypothetical protein AGMMS49992_22940 [Clostridia bacterium]|nr:hypothetical protein AGMMS49992_22940 [Clostridia bacterium]